MTKPDPTDLSSLLEARKQRKKIVTPATEEEEEPKVLKIEERLEGEKTLKQVGRPPGRRSKPNVNPLNLLIDEEVVAKARYKLSQINRGKKPKMTLSDLVEDFLKRWIKEDE